MFSGEQLKKKTETEGIFVSKLDGICRDWRNFKVYLNDSNFDWKVLEVSWLKLSLSETIPVSEIGFESSALKWVI